MTEGRTHCENLTSAPVVKNNLQRSSMLGCLSQWLWSTWATDHSEARDDLQDSPTVPDEHYTWSKGTSVTHIERETPSYTSFPQPEIDSQTDTEEDSFPCKGCRMQGTSCDRKRPRCSHCLDQQVLCFYVEPFRVSRRKAREARLMRTQLQRVPLQSWL